MKWTIELITNKIVANIIEIEAESIVKLDHQRIMVDRYLWHIPGWLSFGEVGRLTTHAGDFACATCKDKKYLEHGSNLVSNCPDCQPLNP
ncbi:MAG: hypothetical protein MJA29_02355, partial [Candidatus Omnitrophica bacterium]|nr:hypothetical protein [Candidatus Omnitrophota bacterium]